jgi:hypothetical protein
MIQSKGELFPIFLSFSTMIQEQLTPLEQVQLEIAELTKEYKECYAKLLSLLDKPDRTETEEKTIAGYQNAMAGLNTQLDNLSKMKLVLLKKGNTLTIVRKQFLFLVKTAKKKKEHQLSVIGDWVYPFSVWSSSCSSSSSSQRQSKPIRQPGQKQSQISQPLLSKSSQSRMFISKDSEASVKLSEKDELLKKEE